MLCPYTDFRANHPHAKVYNQDVCSLLNHTIQVHDNKAPPPLEALNGTTCPKMPLPGEVDLITGGMLYLIL
jgi:hypothetical protein